MFDSLVKLDFPYPGLLWMFAAFILACGATHLMGAVVLWEPMYGLDALLKAVTAVISLATAIVIWPFVPQALEIPSPGQLQQANARLQAAIVESSEDAIVGQSLDGTITSWNRGAERMYGWRADETRGQPIEVLIPPERLSEDQAARTAISRGECFVVDLAEDGLQAVAKAATNDYRLVLMGMQMPNMDGLDATREIRRTGCSAAVPVIAMTANAFAEDRAPCLEAGMDDFISKPVEPDQLYAITLSWLGRPSRG